MVVIVNKDTPDYGTRVSKADEAKILCEGQLGLENFQELQWGREIYLALRDELMVVVIHLLKWESILVLRVFSSVFHLRLNCLQLSFSSRVLFLFFKVTWDCDERYVVLAIPAKIRSFIPYFIRNDIMKTSFAITKYGMQEIRPTIKFILFYYFFFFHFRVCLRRKLVKWRKHM